MGVQATVAQVVASVRPGGLLLGRVRDVLENPMPISWPWLCMGRYSSVWKRYPFPCVKFQLPDLQQQMPREIEEKIQVVWPLLADEQFRWRFLWGRLAMKVQLQRAYLAIDTNCSLDPARPSHDHGVKGCELARKRAGIIEAAMA